MRRLMHALIVAVVAFAALAAGAGAATIDQTAVASGSEARTTPLYALVARPYGAALRDIPADYGGQKASLACGEVWPVLERRDGWVKILARDVEGWVSEGRVNLAGTPRPADCSTARYMPVGSSVYTHIDSGCLSLQARPTPAGATRACVDNGHEYEIVSGPYGRDPRQDWFEVDSPSTGSGWVLAEYLYPI